MVIHPDPEAIKKVIRYHRSVVANAIRKASSRTALKIQREHAAPLKELMAELVRLTGSTSIMPKRAGK
jgi:hypothetical protein